LTRACLLDGFFPPFPKKLSSHFRSTYLCIATTHPKSKNQLWSIVHSN